MWDIVLEAFLKDSIESILAWCQAVIDACGNQTKYQLHSNYRNHRGRPENIPSTVKGTFLVRFSDRGHMTIS